MINAIKINGLSKRYQLGLTHSGSVRELANRTLAKLLRRRSRGTSPKKDSPSRIDQNHLWALRDIDVTIQPGEVVGIIGKNGAGKSTLLKLLSRITYPTTGRIEINGRIASLLEVGTGFHPELTGRENVFLNGTLLGMTRREVARQLDAIVDFSGIESFLDTPVKRYSSGMTVRLGFAVAAHLNPEILVVDEVLAVGDIEFQKRCIDKMHRVAESGQTILFVSHNLASIRSLTSRTVVLSGGRVRFDGSTEDGIAHYLAENLPSGTSGASIAEAPRTMKGLDNKLRMTELRLDGLTRDGCVATDAPVQIVATVESLATLSQFRIGVTVFTQDKIPVGTCFTESLRAPRAMGSQTFELNAHLPLAPGRYHFTISLLSLTPGASDIHDSLADVLPFEVVATMDDHSASHGPWRPGWGFCQLDPLTQCH